MVRDHVELYERVLRNPASIHALHLQPSLPAEVVA
jgi:hypothetical protein